MFDMQSLIRSLLAQDAGMNGPPRQFQAGQIPGLLSDEDFAAMRFRGSGGNPPQPMASLGGKRASMSPFSKDFLMGGGDPMSAANLSPFSRQFGTGFGGK